MGFVNKLKRAVELLKEDESVEKGNDFEKYVVNLFDNKYFSIVNGVQILHENIAGL